MGFDMSIDSRRQAGAVLVGIVLAVGMLIYDRYEPNTFIRRDGSFYATISMGLVKNFSLEQHAVQPQSWYSGTHPGYANLDSFWSNISVGKDGAWYPKHSFLISVAAAPFYAAFGVVGFLVFNALCVVLMLWTGYLIAVRYAVPSAAAIAVLLTALSPMMIEHTYHLSADVFNAALVSLGALLLLNMRPVAGGVVLGIALWARPVTLVLVAPVVIALVWKRFDLKQTLRCGVAMAVPLAAAALCNTLMYGAPWITSYDRVLTVENGVVKIVSARELYTNPLEYGLRLMFESREHGLLVHALPSVVALLGLVPLWRHARALSIALAVGMAGFVASYVYYRYFHARFFFAWEILLCVPLAVLLNDLSAAFIALGERLREPAQRGLSVVRRAPLWASVGTLLLVLLATLAPRAFGAQRYVLSEHVTDARIFRNDFPCDYFNFQHQAWECSRLDGNVQELAGLAIGARACDLGATRWQGLTIAPAGDGGPRKMRFGGLPRGDLALEYGLRRGTSQREACFSISYAGKPSETVCATKAGKREQLRLKGGDEAENSLEISVKGPGGRTLCFDGVIEEAH